MRNTQVYTQCCKESETRENIIPDCNKFKGVHTQMHTSSCMLQFMDPSSLKMIQNNEINWNNRLINTTNLDDNNKPDPPPKPV